MDFSVKQLVDGSRFGWIQMVHRYFLMPIVKLHTTKAACFPVNYRKRHMSDAASARP